MAFSVRSRIDPHFVISLPHASALRFSVLEPSGEEELCHFTPEMFADMANLVPNPPPDVVRCTNNPADPRPVFGVFETDKGVRFFQAGRRLPRDVVLERMGAGLHEALRAGLARIDELVPGPTISTTASL